MNRSSPKELKDPAVRAFEKDPEFSDDGDRAPVVEKPKRSMPEGLVRTITGFSIFFVMIFVTFLGHFYLTLFVFFISMVIFSEVFNLKRNREREDPIKANIAINWWLFLVPTFYFIFSEAIEEFTLSSYAPLRFFARNRDFICFILYMGGFIAWVATLRLGFLRYQLRLFVWAHCTTIIAFAAQVTSHLGKNGLIWWMTPVVFIVMNDTGAYVVGKKFGKTKLICVSPNKTLEGFAGGFVITFLIAFGWVRVIKLLSPFTFWFCPQGPLSFIPFDTPSCALPELFLAKPTWIPLLSSIFGPISSSEFELHCYVIVLFASFAAPFGGFFASAVKRSLKVKDFSDNLPGHGGFLDRFDCQILMNVFLFFYLKGVVYPTVSSLSSASDIVSKLAPQDQAALLHQLTRILSPAK